MLLIYQVLIDVASTTSNHHQLGLRKNDATQYTTLDKPDHHLPPPPALLPRPAHPHGTTPCGCRVCRPRQWLGRLRQNRITPVSSEGAGRLDASSRAPGDL